MYICIFIYVYVCIWIHIPIIYYEIYLQTYRHDMTYSVLKVPLNPNQPTNQPTNRKIISPQGFDGFRPNLARRSSSTLLRRPILKNLKLSKSKMAAAKKLKFRKPRWRRPLSWKLEKSRYLGRGLTDFNKIWHGYAVSPSRWCKLRF